LLLARLVTIAIKFLGWLHRNQTRLAIGQRIAGRLQNGRASAAATDPAFRNGTIAQNHRLSASLGRGGRDRAHDGRQSKRLARRFARGYGVKDIVGAVHQILAR
jgi:hypothetical protein